MQANAILEHCALPDELCLQLSTTNFLGWSKSQNDIAHREHDIDPTKFNIAFIWAYFEGYSCFNNLNEEAG